MPARNVTVTLSFDEAQEVVEALRIYRAAFIGSQIRDRIQDISDRVSDAADIAYDDAAALKRAGWLAAGDADSFRCGTCGTAGACDH